MAKDREKFDHRHKGKPRFRLKDYEKLWETDKTVDKTVDKKPFNKQKYYDISPRYDDKFFRRKHRRKYKDEHKHIKEYEGTDEPGITYYVVASVEDLGLDPNYQCFTETVVAENRQEALDVAHREFKYLFDPRYYKYHIVGIFDKYADAMAAVDNFYALYASSATEGHKMASDDKFFRRKHRRKYKDEHKHIKEYEGIDEPEMIKYYIAVVEEELETEPDREPNCTFLIETIVAENEEEALDMAHQEFKYLFDRRYDKYHIVGVFKNRADARTAAELLCDNFYALWQQKK